MKTVKEISRLTGISARTLHWYDEIGLFKPTAYTAAGYRLYDDKALETLQQILFFREFYMPLKEIRAAIGNMDLDRKTVLKKQRRLLELKKRRLERLTAGIDGILKGENDMDLTVFDRTEINQLYEEMLSHLSEAQRERQAAHYGSMEAWKTEYMEK